MRKLWIITLLVGAGVELLLGPLPTRAQGCKDETSMLDGSKQALTEFKETVKKESLADFESMNHQKIAVNRLDLHNDMLGELASCLDKAAQDAAASKDAAAAAKTQHDATVKLQDKVKQQQGAIKDAKTSISLSCTSTSVAVGHSITCAVILQGYFGPLAGLKIAWAKVEGSGGVTLYTSTCTLSSNGACSVKVTGTKAGTVMLRAVYGGDKNNTSSSKTERLKVT